MKRLQYLFALALITIIVVSFTFKNPSPAAKGSLYDYMTQLGYSSPVPAKPEGLKDLASRGKELVLRGKVNGGTPISKYYQCTTCHNIDREDPDLSKDDPEARLDYVVEQGMPFLPATTFHGIVNKETWYNDDYYEKYGENVRAAQKDLRAAIQLCATECAQGREMTQTEIDEVMAYFWTLELKLEDLSLTVEDQKSLASGSNNEKIDLLKSKYKQKSGATFDRSPADKSAGYALEGNPDNGAKIYRHSCMSCHQSGGVAAYLLEENKVNYISLKMHFGKDSYLNTYDAIRYGVGNHYGYRPYMPKFPLEKLSDQQIEDLRAFVEREAE